MSLPTLNDGNKNKKETPNLPTMPNLHDSNEDIYEEEFQKLEIEDVYDDDDYDNDSIYEDYEPEDLPIMDDEVDTMYLDDEDDYNPDYEEDLESEDESKFVDKKKKRLIPFGGKRAKRKIKSSDFDDRKNILAKTKVMRFVVMLFLFGLVLFGFKNTFFPSHVYTDVQIKQFAAEGAGQTGFPEKRGEAFVENFMEAYLTLDRRRPDLTEVLNYYYGSQHARLSPTQLNLQVGTEVEQKVLIKPKVYEANLNTSYSAQYKVSSYVSSVDGSDNYSTGRWVSFAVNVYYDESNDSLAITPDSPTLIPPYRISEQTVVPERMPLGNGQVNNDIGPALAPTINGFIEAYARSSIDSHESIIQYIDDKNDIDLYDGFGGAVKLKDTPSNSIKRVIYNSDDGIYRVALTVDWVDTRAVGDGKQITYTSKYMMRVKQIDEGKYAVSRFVPYDYYHK